MQSNMNKPSFYAIILINLLIWGTWLWRYHIHWHYLKQKIRAQLKEHPESERYNKIDLFLTRVFSHARSRWISQQDRQQLKKQDDSFTYGEVDCLSFMSTLDKTQPQQGEIFFDLGSGAGKAVMTAALTFDLAQSIGVELLPRLCELAKQRIHKAQTMLSSEETSFSKTSLERLARIQIVTDDFLHVDITHCNILFINATCLSYSTWQNIQNKLLQLKTGSRVIVTSKKILLEPFRLVYQGRTLMSWGMNSIHIYIKD